MECLARLYFLTSEGRQFGPYGSPCNNKCPVIGFINYYVSSINELQFMATDNCKYVNNIIRKKNCVNITHGNSW